MHISERAVATEGEPTRVYRVANEVHYNILAPNRLIEVLERARFDGTKLRLSYGDTQPTPSSRPGRDWLVDDHAVGYICRSNDKVLSIPLLLKTKTAKTGHILVTETIVRIRHADKGDVLYQHPLYHQPVAELRPYSDQTHPDTSHILYRDGSEHRYFPSYEKAKEWCEEIGLTLAVDIEGD